MKKTVKLLAIAASAFISVNALADPQPHFFVQMENQSDHDAAISFQPVVGSVSLTPELPSHTTLSAHQKSQKYGVVFNPLGKDDSFNIVFTGKQDCAFKVEFYAVYNPKITISGYGCFGGGYRVNRDTLELYVSDIHLQKHA
jgi:hypothetical protein